MSSWNVEQTAEREYVLLNKTKTVIRISEHSTVDLGELLSKMEEAGVPLSYTNGLEEIYITILRGDEPDKTALRGDYKDGVIRLNASNFTKEELPTTLIHELGHFLDEQHDLSLKKRVIEEKPKCSRFLPDSYARRNVEEYVCVGFEVFYFGSRASRGKFRRMNPKLYNVIRYLDHKMT